MTLLVLGAISAALSLPFAMLVRAQAGRGALLDRPNERSSHTVATPRGGGLSFVIVTLVGAVLVCARQPGGERLVLALTVGGLPVAAIGLVDDLRGLSPAVRALVHLGAAAAAVAVLDVVGEHGALAAAVCVVALAWLVNLFNFMDGIDGLAGGQSVVAAVGLIVLVGGHGGVARVAAAMAGAVAGFLVLNRPLASIFMGDVGSGFLGMALGVLGLAAERTHGLPVVLSLLLVAPFLVDATGTLLVRVAKRERWYAPHRDHVYQRLVLRGASHGRVTSAYVALAVGLGAFARVLRDSDHRDLAVAVVFVLLTAGWALVRTVGSERVPPQAS